MSAKQEGLVYTVTFYPPGVYMSEFDPAKGECSRCHKPFSSENLGWYFFNTPKKGYFKRGGLRCASYHEKCAPRMGKFGRAIVGPPPSRPSYDGFLLGSNYTLLSSSSGET